jgi:deoxyxylulose-5-phosphate synthase
MRKAFIQKVSELALNNKNIQVLLGDISVFAFEKNNKLPTNIHNMGILEQSIVGFGAGLAADGYYPILHTITPFLIERAFEQIKVNFCLNNLPGLFITVGGICDYYTLGRTHHCANDMSILSTLPNIEFACPTSKERLVDIIDESVKKKILIYIRLTENFLKSKEKKNLIKGYSTCKVFCGEFTESHNTISKTDEIYIDSSLELNNYKWNYEEIYVYEPSIGASFSNRLRKIFRGKIISHHLNVNGPKFALDSFAKTRRKYDY